LFAFFAVVEWKTPIIFESPSFLISLLVFAVVAFVLIRTPLNNAGKPDEPAPPSAAF
jgi:hypothetical protein